MTIDQFVILCALIASGRLGSVAGWTTSRSPCTGEVGEILRNLRSLMANRNITAAPLQGYIVFTRDAHESEYIADQDKRLQYISKFTGSQGKAFVSEREAVLWTDSRYYLQAEKQLNLNCWTLMREGLNDVPSLPEWILNNVPYESRIGVDPFLISSSDFNSIASKLNNSGHKLITIERNLVDEIWDPRPLVSQGPILPFPMEFSGRTAGDKITELLEKIKELNASSIVITALDDIAWLLNLRGSDIEYNPVFFSYVLLTSKELLLFVDGKKITEATEKHLRGEQVRYKVRPYADVLEAIGDVVNNTSQPMIISNSASQAIFQSIPASRRLVKQSIVSKMKSVKNFVEAQGLQKAHIRDGLAVVQYLHWLELTIDKENVTELSGAEKLKDFRSQQEHFRGLSFESVSAVGLHAAMAHFSPSVGNDKQITRDEMYLIDSGGQYWDGTTDSTRTVHFGEPTIEEMQSFTRVLKGFIAVVTSVFPPNTPVSYLDFVARRPLWQAGLDYGHGTGHGVGVYLLVHEYPPYVSSRSDQHVCENMFTSNEPGYYKDGKFGIRLEDVIQVVKADIDGAFGGRGALALRSITRIPLQTKLIDTSLITKEEAKYINDYNNAVFETIGPLLLERDLNDTYWWLAAETKKICSWA